MKQSQITLTCNITDITELTELIDTLSKKFDVGINAQLTINSKQKENTDSKIDSKTDDVKKEASVVVESDEEKIEAYAKYLESQDIIRKDNISKELLNKACLEGRIDIIQSVHNLKKDKNLFTQDLLEISASNGHLDAVKLLSNIVVIYNPWTYVDILDIAASKGHLDVVKFLHSKRATPSSDRTETAIEIAKKGGHSSIVAFLESTLNK